MTSTFVRRGFHDVLPRTWEQQLSGAAAADTDPSKQAQSTAVPSPIGKISTPKIGTVDGQDSGQHRVILVAQRQADSRVEHLASFVPDLLGTHPRSMALHRALGHRATGGRQPPVEGSLSSPEGISRFRGGRLRFESCAARHASQWLGSFQMEFLGCMDAYTIVVE